MIGPDAMSPERENECVYGREWTLEDSIGGILYRLESGSIPENLRFSQLLALQSNLQDVLQEVERRLHMYDEDKKE